MAAPRYTYRAVSALTGLPLVELPLTGCKWTRVRSGAGAWDADLPIGAAELEVLDLVDNSTPNTIEVTIERNRVLLFSGLLVDHEYDSDSQALKLSGRESWVIFDRRFIEDAITYTAVDQGLIVKDILTKAALELDGDFRVDLPADSVLTTGVVRTQVYLATEPKPVSEAIEELAAMDSGFEFTLEPRWSAGTLRHALNFGFPMVGARGGSIAKWTLPGNVRKYTWQKQGGAQANEIFGIGDDGSGKTKIERVKTYRADQPLLQLSKSFRAQTTGATLLAQTQQAAAVAADPLVVASVMVHGNVLPRVGDYAVGDDADFTFNDRYMRGVPVSGRIDSFTVTCPSKGKAESVELVVMAG